MQKNIDSMLRISQDYNRFNELHWYKITINFINEDFTEDNSISPIWKTIDAIFSEMQRNYRSENSHLSIDKEQIHYHILNQHVGVKWKKKMSVKIMVCFVHCQYSQVQTWIQSAYSSAIQHLRIELISEIQSQSLYKKLQKHIPCYDSNELCLNFRSPLYFHKEAEYSYPHISVNDFIRLFEERIHEVFGVDIPCVCSDKELIILQHYMSQYEFKRQSKSDRKKKEWYGGLYGKLWIKGSVMSFLPFILICEDFCIGGKDRGKSKVKYGQGFYTLMNQQTAYFRCFMKNPSYLRSIIMNMNEQRQHHFSEEKQEEFIQKFIHQYEEKNYSPSPYHAYKIYQNKTKTRMIEKLHDYDLFAQKAAAKVLSQTFDNMFSSSSWGFRKKRSVGKAAESILSSIMKGYVWFAAVDIEHFFDSVDKEKLINIVKRQIPDGDTEMVSCIEASIHQGFLYNGTFYKRRIKGLPQGSPLSPVLSNVFLHSYDSEMFNDSSIVYIRYVDDIIMLAKKESDLHRALDKSRVYLEHYGLRFNSSKTQQGCFQNGGACKFLGFNITETLLTDIDYYGFQRSLLSKPLYILEEHAYVTVSGESVEVYKKRRLIASVPLRHISDILVLHSATLSTHFLRRCIDFHIQVVIMLESGYCMTTIKLDSKKFYKSLDAHGTYYAGLLPEEKLVIAKSIVTAKIRSYKTWFSRTSVLSQCRHQLLTIENDIQNRCSTVEELRGYEGAAVKICYKIIASLLKAEGFEFKKRKRKNPDFFNSLLNFVSYLVFLRLNGMIRVSGLNPFLGFLHSENNRYESLVCDIQELFRPQIELFVVKAINEKTITTSSFKETKKGFYLSFYEKKHFIERFEREMQRYNHSTNGSLNDHMYHQIKQFSKAVMNADNTFQVYSWKR